VSPEAGYSGTPLPRKLGIGEGSTFALVRAPDGATALLDPLPAGAREVSEVADADVAVFFVTERTSLEREIGPLAQAVFPDRMLWVAWPKRASGVPTDVSEDVVREVALPIGLVDTKVAAVDATWSGLRLVWRRERRSRP
jgi:hypothetical protein